MGNNKPAHVRLLSPSATVAEPENVPAIAVRREERVKGGRVEEVARTVGELDKLILQRNVPVGVTFHDQGRRDISFDHAAEKSAASWAVFKGGQFHYILLQDVHVCSPAPHDFCFLVQCLKTC